MVSVSIGQPSAIERLPQPVQVDGVLVTDSNVTVVHVCGTEGAGDEAWLRGAPLARRLVDAMAEQPRLTELHIDVRSLADYAAAEVIARFIQTSPTLKYLHLKKGVGENCDVLIRAAVSRKSDEAVAVAAVGAAETTATGDGMFMLQLWCCTVWKSSLVYLLHTNNSRVKELEAIRCKLLVPDPNDARNDQHSVLLDPSRGGLVRLKIEEPADSDKGFMQFVLLHVLSSTVLKDLHINVSVGGSFNRFYSSCISKALGELLGSSKTLERFWLQDNDAATPDPRVMVGLAQNRSIRHLTLSHLNLTYDSKDYLARHIQNNHVLSELDLVYCVVGSKGLSEILTMPPHVHSPLSSLYISFDGKVNSSIALSEISYALGTLMCLEKLHMYHPCQTRYMSPPIPSCQRRFVQVVRSHTSLVSVEVYLSRDNADEVYKVCHRNQAFLHQLQTTDIGNSIPLTLWPKIASQAALTHLGRELLFQHLRGNDQVSDRLSIVELLEWQDCKI